VSKAINFALQFAEFGYNKQFFYSLSIISFPSESIKSKRSILIPVRFPLEE
jgi:hypothetical protein